MKRLAGSLLMLNVVGCAASFFSAQYLLDRFEGPGPLQAEQVFIISKGAGVAEIARDLETAGIIDDRRIFRLGVRYLELGRDMKVGEFILPAAVSMRNAAQIIASGKTVVHRITIPEGQTSQEIIEILAAEPLLQGEITTIPPEGSLLPETYHFSRNDTRQAMLERMSAAMSELLAELWPARAEGLPIATPEEAVILASIVEKETGQSDERALVAGVFVNRLKKNIPLQSDPTVIYGITLGKAPLERALSRKDLKTATPYNTYSIQGLPPGPIANPGRTALEAVMAPAETDFIYFVADGSGGHAFAKTLKEHNRNVAKWRKIEASQKAKAAE